MLADLRCSGVGMVAGVAVQASRAWPSMTPLQDLVRNTSAGSPAPWERTRRVELWRRVVAIWREATHAVFLPLTRTRRNGTASY